LLSLIVARAGDEICGCELTDAFTLTGPTISHHLRVLREAALSHLLDVSTVAVA
jgi:ArsR family transcriptional regulator, arsenate/arsenite/antimonite-responsive transcriptional repressor